MLLPPTDVYDNDADIVFNSSNLRAHLGHPQHLCNRDQAYLSIVITVLPLWAMLTTILVFVLIQFDRSGRATSIYENCTKSTAQYVYHIELRTGETSATYNRRRTTITIDMFDDSQNTLARVSIPGDVIFGRKETPAVPVTTDENERYSELRCTRLWLYRAVPLGRVYTIRITHSCFEQEARIMIYGVELKSAETDRLKTFFPVMHYINAWGSVVKPNACFDHDPLGSISALGGRVSERTSMIGDHLTLVDYIIMGHLYCSLVFYFSTFDFIQNSFYDTTEASYKGLMLGVGCFILVLIVLLFFKLIIKHQYSMHIGTGCWAYTYFISGILLVVASTSTWVYSTVIAYNQICSNTYNLWLMSICIAGLVSLLLTLLGSLLLWLIQPFVMSQPEMFPLPEDFDLPRSSQQLNQSSSKTRQITSKIRSARPSSQQGTLTPFSWPAQGSVIGAPQYSLTHIGAALPSPYAPPLHHQQPTYPQPMAILPPANTQTIGIGQSLPAIYRPATGYHPQQVAVAANQQQQPTAFETGQLPHQVQYYPAQHKVAINLHHLQQAGHITSPQYQQSGAKSPTYHQQTQLPTPGGGIKPSGKKIGSNESTGSTYYQQVMKTKGGVKSISQYGELLKQQKRAAKKQ